MRKNKMFFSTLISIPILFSCATTSINISPSPFKDDYKRIGLNSEYIVDISPLSPVEYNNLRQNILNYRADAIVSSFSRQAESRDLLYSYFGKENSSLSKCTMTSRNDNETRYENRVTISNTYSKDLRDSNGGIITVESKVDEYVYDNGSGDKYDRNTKKETIGEEPVVTKTEKDKSYDEDQLDTVFGANAYVDIKDHFTNSGFTLLGDKAVYGKASINGKENFLIKEAHSIFIDYSTIIGRTYKAVRNYFYEALLSELTIKDKTEKVYGFTNFRFYQEMLILSEAFDKITDIPVLYLEKPTLVQFSEIKYQINYNKFSKFEGKIPEPTEI